MEGKFNIKVCSSPTKDGILNMIKKFYFSENIEMWENFEVWNTKLNRQVGIIKLRKGRYIYFQ